MRLVGRSGGGVKVLFVLSEFRYGKAPILIATDVASRGLGQYRPERHQAAVSVENILKKVVLLSLTFTCAFSEFFSP